MLITNTITMAIDRQQMPPVIDAVQGDANSRAIKIKLTNGGQPWQVPPDASCIIRFGKPDKTGGAYDTLEDGTSAIEVGDNYLQIILAKQVISFPGNVFLQIEMVSNEAYLSTFSIVVNVQEDPSVGTLESDDYVNLSSYVSDEIRRILSDEGVGGAGTFWVHATLDYEAGTAEVVESIEEIYAAYEANMTCCMQATVTSPQSNAKQILVLQTSEKSNTTSGGKYYRITFHQVSSFEEMDNDTHQWKTRATLDEVVVSKFDDEIQNVCFRTRLLTEDDQIGNGSAGNIPGGDEVVISSEEPTDESVKVWINPDEEDLGGSVMVVTVTKNEDNNYYTPNHTHAEVLEWLDNGGSAVLVDGRTTYLHYRSVSSYSQFRREITASGKKVITVFTMRDDYLEYGNVAYVQGEEKPLVDVATAEVGQTIMVEKVDSNGRPTKWKAVDYQPKICGTEETEILPEQTVTFTEDIGWSVEGVAVEVGKTYKITYNGVPYFCECVTVPWPIDEEGNTMPMSVMGNIEMMLGTGDTGEPFACIDASAMGMPGVLLFEAMDGSETFTLSIADVVFQQIPKEFVTNYLPFRFEVKTDGATFAISATPAQVAAAVEAGRQVIMTYKYGNLTTMYLPLMTMTGEEHTFAAGNQQFDLTIQEDGTYAVKS